MIASENNDVLAHGLRHKTKANAQLPNTKHQFVSQMLDTVLAQVGQR